ncbi:MAG: ADP-ribosylglycohydrolase family protein [Chloroflexi bacterium]|nr:ADP-ribosylglycohydrolase family protein [Chloroflexota bacterium]
MELEYALRVAIEAARAAGTKLLEEFRRPGGPRGDTSHADVDTEVEWGIRERLLAEFAAFGYLGEETGRILPASTSTTSYVWLVDPNDGTGGFVEGARGSAVSIALLRDGVPVLGVVYSPTAPDDEGDLMAWAEGCGPLKRNGQSVERMSWPADLGTDDVILLARQADRASSRNAACVSPGRFRAIPSIAYRLALAAAGEASAAVSVVQTVGWDYAAGHALLRATAGAFVDENGEAITYSPDGMSTAGRCFGGARGITERMRLQPWDKIIGLPDPDADLPFDLISLEPSKSVGDAALLRRAQGCLLGQIAGDNLGGLVEFQPAEAIRQAKLDLLRDGGIWGILAGQPTDDSEMALCLARSIVQAGKYDSEAAARAYYAWYQSQPFDIGSTTSRAVRAISFEHVRLGQAALAASRAASSESQANGSLMRVSPLGIAAHGLSFDQVAEAARSDSSLTHPNKVCQEACAVFAVAVAHAVASGMGPQEVYRDTLSWASRRCGSRDVVAALEKAASEPPEDYLSRQGWVLIALQNAFYQILHAPSLKEGVIDTIRRGGDTDTNAAIAGALLGAVYGRDAVPWQWRQMVLSCRPIAGLDGVRHPRPRFLWPVDAMELAERLLIVY